VARHTEGLVPIQSAASAAIDDGHDVVSFPKRHRKIVGKIATQLRGAEAAARCATNAPRRAKATNEQGADLHMALLEVTPEFDAVKAAGGANASVSPQNSAPDPRTRTGPDHRPLGALVAAPSSPPPGELLSA
jgi:hypothetical protein